MAFKYRFPKVSDTFEQVDSVAQLLNALLYGGKAMNHSVITITGAAAKSFEDALKDGTGVDGVPPGACRALCILEADNAEVGNARVCRFKQDDIANPATNANGMPVGDNGAFEISGDDNITNFSIIGITEANTHKLKITWFGAS